MGSLLARPQELTELHIRKEVIPAGGVKKHCHCEEHSDEAICKHSFRLLADSLPRPPLAGSQ
jgi:hypothetical protein